MELPTLLIIPVFFLLGSLEFNIVTTSFVFLYARFAKFFVFDHIPRKRPFFFFLALFLFVHAPLPKLVGCRRQFILHMTWRKNFERKAYFVMETTLKHFCFKVHLSILIKYNTNYIYVTQQMLIMCHTYCIIAAWVP